MAWAWVKTQLAVNYCQSHFHKVSLHNGINSLGNTLRAPGGRRKLDSGSELGRINKQIIDLINLPRRLIRPKFDIESRKPIKKGGIIDIPNQQINLN